MPAAAHAPIPATTIRRARIAERRDVRATLSAEDAETVLARRRARAHTRRAWGWLLVCATVAAGLWWGGQRLPEAPSAFAVLFSVGTALIGWLEFKHWRALAAEADPDRRPGALDRLHCWWFGCRCDDYRPTGYASHVTGCTRCGASDTSYSDQVGYTRHARFLAALATARWRVRCALRGKPAPRRYCDCKGPCAPDCDGLPF